MKAHPYLDKTQIAERTRYVSLFVKNLPANINEAQLRKIFEVYGRVEYVSIKIFSHKQA